MLMRTDPFREFDRLAQSAFAGFPGGTWSRPTAMPMDAYRHGEQFVVEFDLPGVDPSAVDLSVERNVLTVKAERRPGDRGDDVEMVASERTHGVYSRQLFLGENLDTDRISAHYDAGVLTVRIPVAERAKPRSISVEHGSADRKEIEV